MDIRTGPEAADVMASWTTYPARACLNAVSRAFQRGDASHPSQIEPLVTADNARQHWEKTPAAYRHPGEAGNAPKGALIHCGNGEGHVFISMGGGYGASTDYPERGRLSVAPIADILRHFAGNPLLGWSTWINGRAIQGLAQLTEAQKARYRRVAAFLNKHAANLGLPATATESDGIPGARYWKLVQRLGKVWGFYPGADDGDPGPLTYAADEHIWATYVNVAPPPLAPEPTPEPEPPAEEPTPEPQPEPEEPAPEEEPMPPVTPPADATTPPSVPEDVIVPRTIRGPLLLGSWITGSALGALNVGYIYAIQQGVADYPVWLGVATAVFGFVSAQVNAIARANLNPKS